MGVSLSHDILRNTMNQKPLEKNIWKMKIKNELIFDNQPVIFTSTLPSHTVLAYAKGILIIRLSIQGQHSCIRFIYELNSLRWWTDYLIK